MILLLSLFINTCEPKAQRPISLQASKSLNHIFLCVSIRSRCPYIFQPYCFLSWFGFGCGNLGVHFHMQRVAPQDKPALQDLSPVGGWLYLHVRCDSLISPHPSCTLKTCLGWRSGHRFLECANIPLCFRKTMVGHDFWNGFLES